MSFTRNKIRKIILQEIRKKILKEESEPSEIQLTPEAAQQQKADALRLADLFANGAIAPNGVSLTEPEARALATKLYEATKGGTNIMSMQVAGFGTDEDLIIETLQKIPSLADLSFVSHIFSQKYKGFFGKPYDLADVLEDEYGTFTSSEFYDVSAEVRGIYNRALFFLDGNPITVAQMKEIAKAAQQNADALATVQPGGRDDALADALTGTAGAAAVGVGAAAGTGAALGAMGATGILMAAPASAAATGLAAGSIGAGAAATLGAGVGAGAAATGALAGAAGILAGIPVAGWIALGVAAVAVGAFVAFDNEEFDEAELKMLSPDFYLKLDEMFEELAKSFRDKANSIVIPDEAPDTGDQDANTGMVEYPELGFGHTSPYIPKIIKTLNAYAETRNLEGYTPCSGTRWSGKVQECWLAVVPHALANCDKFENHSDIEDVSDWNVMSDQMKSEFPGYVRGPRGCCAFIMDAYYCEIRFGNEAPTSGGGGGGGGSGDGDGDGDGNSGDNTGDQDTDTGSTGTRGGITNRIRVRLNKTIPGGGNTFESHGFTLNGSPNVSEAFANSLIQNFKNERVAKGVKPAILNFLMELDADNNIISVRRQRGDGSARNFVARLRDIDGDLLDVARDLELPSEGSGSPYAVGSDKFDTKGGRGRGGSGKYIKFSMNIRGGSYDGYL